MSDPAGSGQPEEGLALLEASESGSLGSRSLLSAALLGSTATLVVGALGVVRTKVLAVGLDPSGLGLYGQVLTILTALSAASGLGLGLGTTRIVAECRARGDREGLKSALEVSFGLPLAVASLLALLIAASSGALAPLLLDDDRALLIVLAAVAVPVVALQGPLIHALQGFRDVAGAQGSNVFFGVALTAASGAGVVVAGLDGAVLALAAGNLAYAAALGWRLRGLVGHVGVRLDLREGLRRRSLRRPLVRNMLAIGFASLFVGVIGTAGDLVVRTLVLRGDGAAAAGIFQALQLISVQLLGVIVASVVFLSFTAISEAHAAEQPELVRRSVDDTLRLALLLVLPILVAFTLFRDDLVRLLLSSEFSQAGDLLPRQLVGDSLRTVAFALGAAMVPVGLTRAWVAVATATVAAYLVAATALVSAHGLDGAVDAYLLEWGVAALLSVVVLVRRGVFAPSALTLRTLVFGAVAAALILGLPELGALMAALVTVGFVALLVAGGTGREERRALVNRVRAR